MEKAMISIRYPATSQNATVTCVQSAVLISSSSRVALQIGTESIDELLAGMLTSNEQQRLTGSQDLLTLFKLNPLYDEYVRSYLAGNEADLLEPTFANYVGHLPGKLMDPFSQIPLEAAYPTCLFLNFLAHNRQIRHDTRQLFDATCTKSSTD
jgi:hypothetical protein